MLHDSMDSYVAVKENMRNDADCVCVRSRMCVCVCVCVCDAVSVNVWMQLLTI